MSQFVSGCNERKSKFNQIEYESKYLNVSKHYNNNVIIIIIQSNYFVTDLHRSSAKTITKKKSNHNHNLAYAMCFIFANEKKMITKDFKERKFYTFKCII